MSSLQLVLRLVGAFALAIVAGINLWQWVSSTPDHSHPHYHQIYLSDAIICAAVGLLLIIEAALLLTG